MVVCRRSTSIRRSLGGLPAPTNPAGLFVSPSRKVKTPVLYTPSMQEAGRLGGDWLVHVDSRVVRTSRKAIRHPGSSFGSRRPPYWTVLLSLRRLQQIADQVAPVLDRAVARERHLRAGDEARRVGEPRIERARRPDQAG